MNVLANRTQPVIDTNELPRLVRVTGERGDGEMILDVSLQTCCRSLIISVVLVSSNFFWYGKVCQWN